MEHYSPAPARYGLSPEDKERYYVGDDELGKGSIGTVYSGFDHKEFEPRAFKWNHDSNFEKDLIREADLADRAHRAAPNNTPCIYGLIRGVNPRPDSYVDYARSSDAASSSVIVMERCMDPTTFSLINEKVFHFNFCKSLRLGADLFSALAKIHRAGLVHGDMKPENVLCKVTDDLTQPYRITILDFSHAKPVNHRVIWLSGINLIKPPENREEHPADPRTDIHATATIVLASIMNRYIWNDNDPLLHDPHEYDKLVREKCERVDDFVAAHDQREACKKLLLQCLRFNPRERPQKAGDVAESFRKILNSILHERGKEGIKR